MDESNLKSFVTKFEPDYMIVLSQLVSMQKRKNMYTTFD